MISPKFLQIAVKIIETSEQFEPIFDGSLVETRTTDWFVFNLDGGSGFVARDGPHRVEKGIL